jgi:enoyl-CoA hydratase
VVERSAVMGVFCRRFGVPLIDGGTIRLPRLIAQSIALDMILAGREVRAEEALSFGLANRVVEDGTALEEATKLASQIPKLPQLCMRHDRLSTYEQLGQELSAPLKNELRGWTIEFLLASPLQIETALQLFYPPSPRYDHGMLVQNPIQI